MRVGTCSAAESGASELLLLLLPQSAAEGEARGPESGGISEQSHRRSPAHTHNHTSSLSRRQSGRGFLACRWLLLTTLAGYLYLFLFYLLLLLSSPADAPAAAAAAGDINKSSIARPILLSLLSKVASTSPSDSCLSDEKSLSLSLSREHPSTSESGVKPLTISRLTREERHKYTRSLASRERRQQQQQQQQQRQQHPLHL